MWRLYTATECYEHKGMAPCWFFKIPFQYAEAALLAALAQLQELRPKGVGPSQLKALTTSVTIGSA